MFPSNAQYAAAVLADFYGYISKCTFDDAVGQIGGWQFLLQNNPTFHIEAMASQTLHEADRVLNKFSHFAPNASQRSGAEKLVSELYEQARDEQYPAALQALSRLAELVQPNQAFKPLAEAIRLMIEADKVFQNVSARFEKGGN